MNEELKYFDFSKEPGKTLKKDVPLYDGSKPLVSILTAYYNAKKYIDQTAKSIFNQSFPYWEWIIIDDGSTEEGTEEFLDEFAKRDKRVKILRKNNSGCSGARYYGAKHALADILYILDADDVIDETLIECGYWALENNQEATWAYSNTVGFGTQKYLWNKFFDVKSEKKENQLLISAFIRKKALLEFVEYENLEKDIYEDWYLWMNFLKKGYFPVHMNFYGFWYRRLDKSMLSDIKKNKQRHLYAMSKINDVAKQVSNNIEAIQFPKLSYVDDFNETEMLKWGKSFKYKKNKTNLLFIFPWSVVSKSDQFNIELVKGLDKEKYQITIVTTLPSNYIWRQQLEEYATVFDLTTFLYKNEWADFIHYLIKSRNIKMVLNSNSMYGYNILPLIKSYFLDVSIVDYFYSDEMFLNSDKYLRESIITSEVLEQTYIFTNLAKKFMLEKLNQIVNGKKQFHILSITENSKYIKMFENEIDKLISSNNETSINLNNYKNLAKSYLNKSSILDADDVNYDYSSNYRKQIMRDRLWRNPLWRCFVKLSKKILGRSI